MTDPGELADRIAALRADSAPGRHAGLRIRSTLSPHLRAGQATLRVSTGEEGCSLAILLREHRAVLDYAPRVPIFATDLDGRALASERAARFAITISEAGHAT